MDASENVYYTNFMKAKRKDYRQLLYYVEIYQDNHYDSGQFFDRYSSAIDFGRAEVSKLADASVYLTIFEIRLGSNGRFVLRKKDVAGRKHLFL